MNAIASFLQTDRWAAFQQALGRTTFRIRGEQWSAMLMRHELPLGFSYLYCPRGPILQHGTWNVKHETENREQKTGNREHRTRSTEHDGDSVFSEFMLEVARIAHQEKSIFLRWDPGYGIKEQDRSVIRDSSFFIRQTRPVQPRHTVVIDLPQQEEALMTAMHEKTRYNVRLAERKGVQVREVPGSAGSEIFWKLLKETTERDVFASHTKDHYEKLLAIFSQQHATEPFTRLYVAEYGGVPLAAAIMMYHGGVATYLHGASSNRQRNIMAPYLLHWRMMKDAKEGRAILYDLWGIDDGNPRWAGITRFKRGFGGREQSFAPSYDVVFRPWAYRFYLLARSMAR